MAILIPRPNLTWWEKLYLPGFVKGYWITLRHFFDTLLGRTKVTLEYPEEKWPLPPGYRGAPTLVIDDEGREKCVACQLCEFVCPPRAIRITPGEIPPNAKDGQIEKYPREFEIDMLRCIYCGMCEEVCPEQAIYLRNEYALVGHSRAEMVHRKRKLFEMGGVMRDPIKKWKDK
jgi:NADH-quinone oxidoreductase subunit I